MILGIDENQYGIYSSVPSFLATGIIVKPHVRRFALEHGEQYMNNFEKTLQNTCRNRLKKGDFASHSVPSGTEPSWDAGTKKVTNPLWISDLRFDRLRRERLSNLWFLRISQNTQISIYQLFIKFLKNRNITEFLSVSLFLGVKLGVDFEVTPRRMKS